MSKRIVGCSMTHSVQPLGCTLPDRLTGSVPGVHGRLHLLPLVDALRTTAGLPDMLSAQPPGRTLSDRLIGRLTGRLSETHGSNGI